MPVQLATSPQAMREAIRAELAALLLGGQPRNDAIHVDEMRIDEAMIPYMAHEMTRLTGRRWDAQETAYVARMLEYVKTKTYDILYLDAMFRSFLPVSTETPPGAASVVWGQYDEKGKARVVHDYARDFPRVDVVYQEESTILQSVGASYGYSVQDLRASQMAGGQALDARRAAAARRAIEYILDEIASLGSTSHNLIGAAKNSSVNVITTTTGSWSAATTADVIFADLEILANSVEVQSVYKHRPNRILLGTDEFRWANSRVFQDVGTRTAVAAFKETRPGVSIEVWPRLDLANAAGNGPRAICGEFTPDNIETDLPQDFEQLPPQATGMQWEVFCHARTGGTRIYRPLAFVYCDEL